MILMKTESWRHAVFRLSYFPYSLLGVSFQEQGWGQVLCHKSSQQGSYKKEKWGLNLFVLLCGYHSQNYIYCVRVGNKKNLILFSGKTHHGWTKCFIAEHHTSIFSGKFNNLSRYLTIPVVWGRFSIKWASLSFFLPDNIVHTFVTEPVF